VLAREITAYDLCLSDNMNFTPCFMARVTQMAYKFHGMCYTDGISFTHRWHISFTARVTHMAYEFHGMCYTDGI